jgi:ATP-binding cassette, subfamily F, member 3
MISLQKITLRRGSKVILSDASALIQPGEKVGLVGRNGAGKSSLFAMLMGQLQEDNGEYWIPTAWEIATVAQNMPETSDSATDFVLAGDQRLEKARVALTALENDPNMDRDGFGEEFAHAYSDWEDAGGHDAPARAQTLIQGLGFSVPELDQPVNSFSGGWRMRLQLARALMCPSDLLLLDEPTNHLDLDALVWLEAWLKRYEGTMIVISHDREFLDAVTKVTLHIEVTKLTRYGGNYSQFEDLRAAAAALQATAFAKQQDKIAHLQKFIDRFKAKASKAKQAQSRVKALERMEKVGPLLAEADFTFEFKEPANLPNPMLSMTGASFGYPTEDGAGKVIVRNVNKSVLAGERIGILGANGQGKSTVVKTVARELMPLGGEVLEGRGLNIGYFAQQELDVLVEEDNPLDHMSNMARRMTAAGTLSGQSTREQDHRSYLGSFNFTGEQVKQKVGSMSGGEKARLVLAMIVWQRPNLLLLDEPTNHLDLATREALAVALNEFEGTVMLVSHDRSLLRSVCDEFWLVAKGAITPFDGDLDDYQVYLLEQAKEARQQRNKQAQAPAATAASTAASMPSHTSVQAAPEPKITVSKAKAGQMRKDFDKLEAQIATLESEKTTLEARLCGVLDATALQTAQKRLKSVNESLMQSESQWLTLGAELESIS